MSPLSELKMMINSQQNPISEQSKTKSRFTMLFIFGIALVPVVLASYMYLNQVLVPSGRTNHGTLMLPPLAFGQLGLRDTNGQPVNTSTLEGKWALLILSEGRCLAACKANLYKARQVNIALHKESHRVERYYVSVGAEGGSGLTKADRLEYPQLKLVSADRNQLKTELGQKLDANTALEESYLLIADPNGNVMMYYTPEQTGKELLEDLKRLLKVSQIG